MLLLGFWITGPDNLNCKEVKFEAAQQSVVLETGDWFYLSENPPMNCFRLGFSSIQAHMIEPGIVYRRYEAPELQAY